MPVKIPSVDPIKHLVYEKYPDLFVIAQKENGLHDLLAKRGLVDLAPTLETHEWPSLPDEAENYRLELLSLDESEVEALYIESIQKKDEEADQKQFFSKFSANADFDYWSKMPGWKVDEAVALTLGKNPKVVNKDSLKDIFSSPFVQRYYEIREMVSRSRSVGLFTETKFVLESDHIQPHKFVKWAQNSQIGFPNELMEKVLQFYEANKPPKTAVENAMERLEQGLMPHPSNLAKIKLETALSNKAQEKDFLLQDSNTEYIPPYLRFMLQAVKTLNLSSDERTSMDEIINWLNENWPATLEGKSQNLVKYMATLLRRPEDKRGGNTAWKQ